MKGISVGQTVEASVYNGEVVGEVVDFGHDSVTIEAEKKRITVDGETLAIDYDDLVVVKNRAIIGEVNQ